ncbi:transporter [Niabella insulamsoli]|uniref:transporter n=1 Tax=Niabella insulamsoli TaxID=3144874 RepID=UPI0031FC4A44
MKKLYLILFIFGWPIAAVSCDICGCGAGNNYIGILPEFHKHIVGLRYRFNRVISHVGVGGAKTPLTTAEQYNIVEAWGGWNLSDKVRVMTTVPYSFNQKTNDGGRAYKSGLGDISVFGFYQVLNTRKTVSGKESSRLMVQSLWLGGGVKLATGKYDPTSRQAEAPTANLFQLGTGSYDFNLNAMYDIRLQDAGLNINGNYKLNTANQFDYQYGDKASMNAQLYYKFRTKHMIMIAPNAGIQYEHSQTDRDDNIKVITSGGNLVMGTLGLETAFGKCAVGANYQTPLSQSLARGIVKAENRWMVHFAIAL